MPHPHHQAFLRTRHTTAHPNCILQLSEQLLTLLCAPSLMETAEEGDRERNNGESLAKVQDDQTTLSFSVAVYAVSNWSEGKTSATVSDQ